MSAGLGGIAGSERWRSTSRSADQRTWKVPTGRGALGQSNVFYGIGPDGQPRRDSWILEVVRRIETYDPEDAATVEVVRAAGQGTGLSVADRLAVEEWAMAAAEDHYRRNGYETEVHGRPFDLLCRRGKKELRVEVKGTTGEGSSVLVTIGEVKSARAHATEMFILSKIELGPDGARGGRQQIIAPWNPTDAQLDAKVLRYPVGKATTR